MLFVKALVDSVGRLIENYISSSMANPGPSHGGRLIIEGASFNRTTLLYPPENMLLVMMAGNEIDLLVNSNVKHFK